MNELSLLDSIFGNDGFSLPAYRAAALAPKVDVVQKKGCYVLSMDLPGKTEKDVDITLKNDVLTISSSANASSDEKREEEDVTYILRERGSDWAQFKRSFTLPKDIDSGNVKAFFKNGILTVEIARRQDSSEKKISIQIE